MKILMTSETYAPRIGGAEVHVVNLLTKLKGLGHEVTLVTNEPGEVSEGVVRIPWKKSVFFTMLYTLWKHSKECDIIHSHYCHRLAFFSALIGRVRNVPVVITEHGMGILNHPHTKLHNRLVHSFYRYMSLKLASKIISTSQDLADIAYKYIPKSKVVIIMNGYDDTLFKVVETSESITPGSHIVTVRRLVPKNGIQYLIEAMPYLLKINSAVRYTIVGDGPLREKIEKRIKELELENAITLVGMQPNDVVVEYLQKADAVIFPSTAESSSIACAEAMGMKKMVIASKVGGLIELLGRDEERGILVSLVPWEHSSYDAPVELPREKYELLAKRIAEGLEQTELNELRRKNAYQYARSELCWDAVIAKTVAIFTNLSKETV
jgi:glycosyltransferase involved in cell wall biosynthesis